MIYKPAVVAAQQAAIFSGPTHVAALFQDIKTSGMVQYRYLLFVFVHNNREPCLVVSSELFGQGPMTVLGLFDETRHQTFYHEVGDWSDIVAFTNRAVAIASERLNTTFVEHPRKQP
jgi:hypothetical protein